ncbi:MAG: hypothetical protein MUF00_13340 [Gemmatimonadaceae bacterium]|nr:hypothetical protein [Gemmatimonadaceae bacterium]
MPVAPLFRSVAVLAVALIVPALGAQPPASNAPAELIAINDSLRALRQPRATNGVPDYSAEAITRWRRGLDALARRHTAMRTVDWPIPDRVDHALVGAQLAAFDFELRVLRPWARDPGHWVDLIARTPYADDFELRVLRPWARDPGHWVDLIARTPYADVAPSAAGRDRTLAQLRAVPALLAEARTRLTAQPG